MRKKNEEEQSIIVAIVIAVIVIVIAIAIAIAIIIIRISISIATTRPYIMDGDFQVTPATCIMALRLIVADPYAMPLAVGIASVHSCVGTPAELR